MKRMIVWVSMGLLICSLVILHSCGGKVGPAPDVGSIILVIDSGSLKTRTVIPDVSMDVGYYVVRGNGPAGSTFYRETSVNALVIAELAIGVWSVTVEAWNGEDPAVRIGEGENLSITVVAGKTTPAIVNVHPIVGDGKLSVYVTWPAGAISNPVIEYTLVDANDIPATTLSGIPVSLSFNVNAAAGTAESINNTVKAGYYLLTLSLKSGTAPLWMQPIAVRIIAVDQPATEVRANLTSDNIAGSIDLTVIVDLQDPIDITFNGQQELLFPDQEVTVTADTTVKGTPASVNRYRWYVGGLEESTDSFLVLKGSELLGGLAEGKYRVDLVVWKGNIIASDYFYFEVVPYELSVTVYDSIETKNPVQDVLVFTSDPADGSFLASVKTNSNGYAEVGTLGKSKITFGLAYEIQSEADNFRIIQTMYDLPGGGDWDVYLDYGRNGDDWGEQVGTINIQLDGLPEDYEWTHLVPMDDWKSSEFTGLHEDVKVYSHQRQDDGKISMIGVAGSSENTPLKYGWLLQQDFPPAGIDPIHIPMPYDPTHATYKTTIDVDEIDVSTMRKGVRIELGNIRKVVSFHEGNFHILDQFPLGPDESYVIGAGISEQRGDDMRGFHYREYILSLPAEYTVNIPDYSIKSVLFNPGAKTVSWTKDGVNSLVDFSTIDLRCNYSESDTNYKLMWLFVTDGVNTSVSAPALPAEIADWFDFQYVTEPGSDSHYYYPNENGGEVYIQVESGDYIGVNGFQELIDYSQENVIDYSSGPEFSAYYMKPEPPGYGY